MLRINPGIKQTSAVEVLLLRFPKRRSPPQQRCSISSLKIWDRPVISCPRWKIRWNLLPSGKVEEQHPKIQIHEKYQEHIHENIRMLFLNLPWCSWVQYIDDFSICFPWIHGPFPSIQLHQADSAQVGNPLGHVFVSSSFRGMKEKMKFK